MPLKNIENDFQKQAEEIVKKSHSKKVYFVVAIIFTAIAIGLIVGIFVIINNHEYLKNNKNEANNEIIKPINQKTKKYYDALEKKCKTNCCLSSLKIMRENNYKEVDEDGKCPDGLETNTVIWKECPQVLEWCESIENKNCVEDGEKKKTLKDMCCGESKFFSDASYISEIRECVSSQRSICLNCGNGICGIGENQCNCPEDCEEQIDTSDWRTYRNEEFGFEIEHKHFSGKVCSPCVDINNNIVSFYLYKDGKDVPYSDFIITILKNDKEFSTEKLVKSIRESVGDEPWFSGRNMTEEKTEVNGYDAYVFDNVWAGDSGEKVYFITYKDQAIRISFVSTTPNYNIADSLKVSEKMLSTFKFID